MSSGMRQSPPRGGNHGAANQAFVMEDDQDDGAVAPQQLSAEDARRAKRQLKRQKVCGCGWICEVAPWPLYLREQWEGLSPHIVLNMGRGCKRFWCLDSCESPQMILAVKRGMCYPHGSCALAQSRDGQHAAHASRLATSPACKCRWRKQRPFSGSMA